MNVRFTGRHVGIPEADREYVDEKLAGFARYHRRLQDIEVRVTRDGADRERVELEADLGHMRVVATSDAPRFRPAFDAAVETLKRRLLKDKEKVVGKRRRAGRRPAGEGGTP